MDGTKNDGAKIGDNLHLREKAVPEKDFDVIVVGRPAPGAGATAQSTKGCGWEVALTREKTRLLQGQHRFPYVSELGFVKGRGQKKQTTTKVHVLDGDYVAKVKHVFSSQIHH